MGRKAADFQRAEGLRYKGNANRRVLRRSQAEEPVPPDEASKRRIAKNPHPLQNGRGWGTRKFKSRRPSIKAEGLSCKGNANRRVLRNSPAEIRKSVRRRRSMRCWRSVVQVIFDGSDHPNSFCDATLVIVAAVSISGLTRVGTCIRGENRENSLCGLANRANSAAGI